MRHARLISKPRSGTFFQTIGQWISECEAHTICPREAKVPLPRRVIDVQPRGGALDASLYETVGEYDKYVCLSHCCGQKQPLVTTTFNLGERKQRILWQDFPLTFRHAIEITRWLNVRYLWIDSLCILQSSEEDWGQELARMGLIY
jgi:Heterokaryon incompatibility protein (HET)